MQKASYKEWLIFANTHTAGPNSMFDCNNEEPECQAPWHIDPGDTYRREFWGYRSIDDNGKITRGRFVRRYHDQPPCYPDDDDPGLYEEIVEEDSIAEEWPLAA